MDDALFGGLADDGFCLVQYGLGFLGIFAVRHSYRFDNGLHPGFDHFVAKPSVLVLFCPFFSGFMICQLNSLLNFMLLILILSYDLIHKLD